MVLFQALLLLTCSGCGNDHKVDGAQDGDTSVGTQEKGLDSDDRQIRVDDSSMGAQQEKIGDYRSRDGLRILVLSDDVVQMGDSVNFEVTDDIYRLDMGYVPHVPIEDERI